MPASRVERILDVGNWVAVSVERQLYRLKRHLRPPKRGPEAGVYRSSEFSVSPLDLYVYLKARFGPPNDVIMGLRSKGTDNLVQWAYALQSGNHPFTIHATTSGLSFFERLTPEQWRLLSDTIKADFQRLGPEMSRIRRGFERWTLFINPYRRLRAMLSGCVSELNAIQLEPPAARPLLMRQAEAEIYQREMRDWSEHVQQALRASAAVRMLAPVMAEALVNLLIFLLVRPEVRKDARLYQSVVRQHIDVRIRSLHVNCHSFEKAVDVESSAFKDFLRLMDGRNDFLHGNVDPSSLGFGEVYFDDEDIPLFRDDEGIHVRFIRNSLKFIEPSAALADFEAAEAFGELLLASLLPEAQRKVRKVMDEPQLGWKSEQERVGILFPDALPEHFLIEEEG